MCLYFSADEPFCTNSFCVNVKMYASVKVSRDAVVPPLWSSSSRPHPVTCAPRKTVWSDFLGLWCNKECNYCTIHVRTWPLPCMCAILCLATYVRARASLVSQRQTQNKRERLELTLALPPACRGSLAPQGDGYIALT